MADRTLESLLSFCGGYIADDSYEQHGSLTAVWDCLVADGMNVSIGTFNFHGWKRLSLKRGWRACPGFAGMPARESFDVCVKDCLRDPRCGYIYGLGKAGCYFSAVLEECEAGLGEWVAVYARDPKKEKTACELGGPNRTAGTETPRPRQSWPQREV